MTRIKYLTKYLEDLYWETGVFPASEEEHKQVALDLFQARKEIKSIKENKNGEIIYDSEEYGRD